LPELSCDLLTRIAFNFGTMRRVTANDHNRGMALSINIALAREVFLETEFGDIVFNGDDTR